MFTSGRVGPSVIFRGIHCVSFVGPDIMIGWSSRDVFVMRSTIFFSNRRVVGTVSLKEMLRNEGSSFFYTVSCPRGACREEGSDWLNLELLRCDWLNLELLRCDWLNLELLRYDWSSDTLL